MMISAASLAWTNATLSVDNVTDTMPGANNTSLMTSGANNTSLVTPVDPRASWPQDCLIIPLVPGTLPWDNPGNLISKEVREVFTEVVTGGILTLCFIFGCPANIINMIVFVKQGLKERINLCLFSLSLADFLVIVLHFAWSLDWVVFKITGNDYWIPVLTVFMNSYVIGLAGFIYVSSFLSAVIAMERCFCVVSPFRSQSILQTRTMAAIIAVATVVIVGGHFLLAAQWRVVCIFDPFTGIRRDALWASEFYNDNADLVQVVEGVVYGVAIPGLCLTAVTVATVITVVRLRAMARWRGKATSANDSAALTPKDVALTRMLVGVSVLYIVCTTPGFLFHTAVLFVPDLSLSGQYYNTFLLLISMQQAFTFINSSVNIIIYYITGSKFRNTLNAMCCKSASGSKQQKQQKQQTQQQQHPTAKASNSNNTSFTNLSAASSE